MEQRARTTPSYRYECRKGFCFIGEAASWKSQPRFLKFSEKHLETIIEYYNYFFDLAANGTVAQLLLVAYEDLVAAPEPALAHVADLLALDSDRGDRAEAATLAAPKCSRAAMAGTKAVYNNPGFSDFYEATALAAMDRTLDQQAHPALLAFLRRPPGNRTLRYGF